VAATRFSGKQHTIKPPETVVAGVGDDVGTVLWRVIQVWHLGLTGTAQPSSTGSAHSPKQLQYIPTQPK